MEDFQVFVKPVGADCNLACSYCYYREKKTSHRMSDGLLEKYIIQHIKTGSGSELYFSWHGGEPTLAGLDFFKRVVFFQRKHLPPQTIAVNGLQTNGTLLNERWCQFLKRENFVVGISLDGPEKFHSPTRLRKDGRCSFRDTLEGLHFLRKYEIPFEILCVVNSHNVGFPLEVYRYFRDLKAQFITFLPLVERDSSMKISERSVDAKAFGKFLCAVFEEWKDSAIGSIKIQIIEEALRTAFGVEHTLCIFKEVCGRVPVVESNGDFYSCDHFVDQAHLIGNLNDCSLVDLLENPLQTQFGKLKRDTLPGYCLRCEVLQMCNGACPKDRFISTPDGEYGLNYLCEGYKLFFNHIKPFAELVSTIWRNQ